MRRWCTVMVVGAAAAGAAAHGPIEIGRYIDNSLVFHFDEPQPVEMGVLPGHPGFAIDDLAFESLMMQNEHEQFPIAAGSDIRLMLVSIDAGLTLYNGASPVPVGGELVFGAPHFHIMPLWTVDAGPVGAVYHATVRVRDAAALQLASAPFEISFVTVPGPGSFMVLVAGVVLAARGRRRARLQTITSGGAA